MSSVPQPTDIGAAAATPVAPAIARAYRMGALEWVMLVTLATVWGGSFFFNKVVLRELPPFTLVWVRAVLGALLLVVLVRLGGQSLRLPLSVWKSFAVIGVLNNLLPFSLISYGQTQIASGLASILNATTPLFTVLVAHLATRDERMTPPKLIGIAFGLAGVTVMIGIDALRGLGLHVLAQVAILIAAMSYACASVFGRRLREVPAMVAACGPIICGAVMMTPIALIVDRPWNLAMPGAATWGSILGLVVLCTALSYYLYFRILAAAGATNLMLVTFLIPVSALLLGVLVLDEIIEPRQFAGMALSDVGRCLCENPYVSHQNLQIDFEGGIAMLWLNRPAVRNAFDDTTIAELDAAFTALAADSAVRAVILAGRGTAFCAGADLNWMTKMAGYSVAENRADALALARMLQRLYTLPKPTIARVHGPAFAGGMGLVCACDIAIASTEAQFRLSEVRIGLTPATISPYVINAIGERQARRWFLTAETFDAAEALRIGLVHEAVAPQALDERVARLAAQLVQGSPAALAASKELIAAVARNTLDDALIAGTAARIADARASAEGKEGVRAFLEKRRPSWLAPADPSKAEGES